MLRTIRKLSTKCVQADFLDASAWYRHHLYLLGYDKLKLDMYKKFLSLQAWSNGAGVKNLVHDLARFIKQDCTKHPELMQHITSLAPERPKKPSKWLYICVAQMILSDADHEIDLLSDTILELYIQLRGDSLSLESKVDQKHQKVLRLAKKYYKSSVIDYRSLYDHTLYPRKMLISEKGISISLPPLPQIRSKSLLAKSLIHKELYRGLMAPRHNFYGQLKAVGLSEDPQVPKILRHDLLLLDGFGDFFLSMESSEFLCKFKRLYPYTDDNTFGKKTYYLLRTILATNSLLLRLALAYGLPFALKDPYVLNLLRRSYIPRTLGYTSKHEEAFEEEFLADYFEQYVGALYLEDPETAKIWINELFGRICSLIADYYHIPNRKCQTFDYKSWSADVIGRAIY